MTSSKRPSCQARTTCAGEGLDEVLRAVKVRAARSGKGDSEVIEEALRRDLGLAESPARGPLTV